MLPNSRGAISITLALLLLAPAGAQAQSAAPVLAIPGAAQPPRGPVEAPPGPPYYRPDLPDGTPAAEEARDPALPVADLAGALDRAYWTNPDLLAQRARTRSLDYRVPQARGQYGPQLEYSAAYGYQRDNFEQALGGWTARSGWTTTANAVLRQPLFTFGRLRAGEDAARATSVYGLASLRVTEQQTLLEAINAYASVLRDRIGVAIAADNVELLSRQSQDTDTRLAARESTSTDSQQVASRLELARAQLLTAQSAAAASEASFLRYVGAPAGALVRPGAFVFPVRTLEDAYAYGAEHNPVIAAAHAREQVSRAQLTAARADLLPRVDLTGQASYGTQSPFFSGLHQTELRGAVTISGTLDSGIRRARIGEAEAANDADWRLVDSALRENRAELAAAWNEWQAQTASLDRLSLAVTAARNAYEGSLLQERAGLRTTLDLLELARDLLQARSSYNAASAAAFVAEARVLAAMGVLDRRTLAPGAAAYDADAHRRKTYWQADFPLLTPLSRTFDSLFARKRAPRPIRDPAAPLATGSGVVKP